MTTAKPSGPALPFDRREPGLSGTLGPSHAPPRPALPFAEREGELSKASVPSPPKAPSYGTGTVPSTAEPSTSPPAAPIEPSPGVLPLERYADLMVLIASSQDRQAALGQFGITEETLRVSDAHWNEQMLRDAKIREAFLGLMASRFKARSA